MMQWIGLVVIAGGLLACGSAPSRQATVRALDPDSPAAQELPPEAKALVEQLKTPVPGQRNPNDYRIGALDLIEISVFQVPELSRKVRVNSSGSVGLPLIGAVQAEGLTVDQLEEQIGQRLEESYLQDAHVSVFVEEYVSQRVTVEGSVRSPGLFPLKGRTSLLQTIAMAGGTDDMANEQQIAVFRNTDKGRVVGIFDLRQIRAGSANDPEIRPDDIVVVDRSGPRSFLKTVIQNMPLLTIGAIF
jgi:polysaccharide export outer membrane protein